MLCARCLDKNPKSRPQFDDLLRELAGMHAAYLQVGLGFVEVWIIVGIV